VKGGWDEVVRRVGRVRNATERRKPWEETDKSRFIEEGVGPAIEN